MGILKSGWGHFTALVAGVFAAIVDVVTGVAEIILELLVFVVRAVIAIVAIAVFIVITFVVLWAVYLYRYGMKILIPALIVCAGWGLLAYGNLEGSLEATVLVTLGAVTVWTVINTLEVAVKLVEETISKF